MHVLTAPSRPDPMLTEAIWDGIPLFYPCTVKANISTPQPNLCLYSQWKELGPLGCVSPDHFLTSTWVWNKFPSWSSSFFSIDYKVITAWLRWLYEHLKLDKRNWNSSSQRYLVWGVFVRFFYSLQGSTVVQVLIRTLKFSVSTVVSVIRKTSK